MATNNKDEVASLIARTSEVDRKHDPLMQTIAPIAMGVAGFAITQRAAPIAIRIALFVATILLASALISLLLAHYPRGAWRQFGLDKDSGTEEERQLKRIILVKYRYQRVAIPFIAVTVLAMVIAVACAVF